MKITYDLHTHILPGVDDGAQTVEDALKLIDALSMQGIKNICLTPHFYTHKESIKDFLVRRQKAFEEFLPHKPEEVNIRLGAEVYVTKYLFAEVNDLLPLCIEGTSYMVSEFSYDSKFSDSTMRQISRLRDLGITPIIPHIERYPVLMKDKSVLEDLIYMGVVMQSNANSFTDIRTKRKLLKLLREGYIQVLSSDTHSLKRNPPESFALAQACIVKKCGLEAISTLESNASEIF